VHAWLGGLLYEWNDLDAAMHHLTTAVTLGEGQVDTSLGPGQQLLVDAYLTLARVRQARGNAAGALEMIHKAEQSAQEQFPAQLGQVAAARVRLSLGQNDVETAVRWARECGLAPDDELGHEHEYEHLTLARVLLAQGRLDEARELLDRLGQAAESRQCLGSVIESLALQALVFQAEGRADKAMTTLERALSLAEPEGYVRLFVDEGTPMAELLSAFRRQPSAVRGEYVATLLAAFQAEGPGGAEATPRRLQTATLFEPLTERELEVLGLIADGLSNREIAGALVIAVTTVKKHASNIYGKLGVTSRTQAAARARELDLR
jgi:LuxR family maltose regulon positive regulatory protein